MRIHRVPSTPLVLAIAAWAAACSGEGLDPQGQCSDDPTATQGPLGSDATRVGFVSIRDILDQTDDEAGVPQTVRSGRLQAGFADLSAVTSTPAQVMPLGPSCFGLISLPVKSGQSEPLTMAEIRVEGTARGSVLASQASPGTYVAVGDPLLGADALRFLGTADPSTPFPGFDEALPALRSDVMLSVPAADGTAAGEPPQEGTA